MTVNDFRADLRWSEEASDEPFWTAVYAQMFPGCRKMMNDANNLAQRRGIDRVLLMPSGSVTRVQEKKRREDWPDILLEYEHRFNDGRRKPGWMEEEPLADWLAYAFLPSKRCYFMPWPSLQKAWRELRRDWFAKATAKEDGFVLKVAPNKDYRTHSIAVPIDVLLECVKWAQIITLADAVPIAATPRQGRLFTEGTP